MTNLDVAHRHSGANRLEVLQSNRCGCFGCRSVFWANEIVEWRDPNPHGIGQTAVCPLCGIDSVIGDASGYPLTSEFLQEMWETFFG